MLKELKIDTADDISKFNSAHGKAEVFDYCRACRGTLVCKIHEPSLHDIFLNNIDAYIDECLYDEVTDLNNKGITTISSCCGHSSVTTANIVVDFKDRDKMTALGYFLVNDYYTRGLVYTPKTECPNKEIYRKKLLDLAK